MLFNGKVTLQQISDNKAYSDIHWIEIYPVKSVIQPSSNQDLVKHQRNWQVYRGNLQFISIPMDWYITIQKIRGGKKHCVVHWMEIYTVDRVIRKEIQFWIELWLGHFVVIIGKTLTCNSLSSLLYIRVWGKLAALGQMNCSVLVNYLGITHKVVQ